MEVLLASIPIAAVAYLSSMDPAPVAAAPTAEEEKAKDQSWVSKSVQLYLQDGISAPKVKPNDFYEISYVNPRGPINEEMSQAEDPQQALYMLGKHELERDKLTSSMYAEFIRRRSDYTIRSVDQPMTQTHLIGKGSEADQKLQLGAKFTEAPFPVNYGVDRFYPRYWTGPFWER